MVQINIHEAKTHLSKLIERVTAGEEIIIARAGKPVVRMVSATPKSPRVFGFAKGTFEIADDAFAPMSEAELNHWYK